MTTLRKVCIKKGARKLTPNKYKLEIKKSQEKSWLFLRKNPHSIHAQFGISSPSVFPFRFSLPFSPSVFPFRFLLLFLLRFPFFFPLFFISYSPPFTSSSAHLYFVAFVHYYSPIFLHCSQIYFLIFWTLYTSYNYSKYYQLIILNIAEVKSLFPL